MTGRTLLARQLRRSGLVARLSGSSLPRRFRCSLSAQGLQDSTIEDVLSSYPIFNLDDDRQGRETKRLGPQKGDEAILTLSGGVDSSVAAYMAVVAGGLKPVRTIFMRNWNSLEERQGFEPGIGGAAGCQWLRDWECVQKTARWFGLDEPELVDLSTAYWNNVFSPSLDEWSQGRTPNPDILCNREVKFGELLRKLDLEHQATGDSAFGRRTARRWLVTGHYAGVHYFHPHGESGFQHGKLLRARDENKDQAYFLSGVDSLHLGRSHFPLANVHKSDVRALARRLGMPTAESEESMGICFVGKRDKQSAHSEDRKTGDAKSLGFAGFLGDYIDPKPGPIVTLDGTIVGTHHGFHTMTIGQRARIGGERQRYFVAAKRLATNEIVIVPSLQHPMLRCSSLEVKVFHVVCSSNNSKEFQELLKDGHCSLQAQIRHRQEPVPCRAEVLKHNGQNGTLQVRVHFDVGRTMDSVAEGQICALYFGRECLGSGEVCSVDTLASRAL